MPIPTQQEGDIAMTRTPLATVVGSGPNGLAAAITLAQAGCQVRVLEAEATIGGGTRSAALTLPGFVHDVCSAVHPLAVASLFFRTLPLAEHGLDWIQPSAPLAHPLADGSAVMLERSMDDTSAQLGGDAMAWRKLFEPMVAAGDPLIDALLAPLYPPRHPITMGRFGLHAIRSARALAESRFGGKRARALFAGIAAHAVLPLEATASASFGLVLGLLAHAGGWPIPRGGSQQIANALASYLTSLGGEILIRQRVTDAGELDDSDLVLFDVTPRQLLSIGGELLPARYRHRLARYQYGPAVFKLDWALHEPIPWQAAECARGGTVHLGGTLEDIARSEHAMAHGDHAEQPFVLLTQPSLFDRSRAPAGQHTAWAYCHVPNGSTFDMAERIEAQVERFAPGFGDVIAARHASAPAALEQHNANYIGGDIVGGANTLRQIIARPVLSADPYAIPVKGWYLCSASTPPGGGVHGMCGYNAARSALRSLGIPP
ncbi:MAG TPA: NAD(P)/FAD-dependent oxidoreductase [Gemmatimonadales bacterium]